jgi:CO/xanthine dehydrogenase FAD-binding subunit
MTDGHSDRDVWSIGADASLQDVYVSPGCPPLLVDALSGAYTWQNRNRRLVGRALVSSSIAPQWSAALLALGATVTLEEEPGTSEVLLEDLLERRVKGTPAAVSVRTGGLLWGESRVGRTPADEPIVDAIAVVELEGRTVRWARVALTGAWSKPAGLAKAAHALLGRELDRESITSVAQAVAQEVSPTGDFRGSVEYRTAMAEVLTRRALEQCLARSVQEDDRE